MLFIDFGLMATGNKPIALMLEHGALEERTTRTEPMPVLQGPFYRVPDIDASMMSVNEKRTTRKGL